MNIFQKSGSFYWPVDDAALQVVGTLPPGVFTVMFDIQRGYFLAETEGFSLPKKLYGKTNNYSDRILKTFNEPERGDKMLGVLLAGEKGSGKTLLAKTICIKSGLPVLIVNAPYHNDAFLKLIQGINQRCIVFFDEFEKTYSDKKLQEAMLTLFDGVYSGSAKLLLCTVNNKYELREFFHNRPGRLYYNISFEGVTPDFIREYCEDVLVDKGRLEEIIKTSLSCGSFNFDMLQALVAEINRYPEDTIEEVLEVLNVKPYTMTGGVKYRADVVSINHPDIVWKNLLSLNMSPLSYMLTHQQTIPLRVQAQVPNKVPKKDDDKDYQEKIDLALYFHITKDHLRKVSEDGSTYAFEVQVECNDEDYEGYMGLYDFRVTFDPESKTPVFGSWQMGRFA